MTVTDGVLIIATLISPLLAVQAQKAIERFKARRDAREKIFKILMATRATQVSPEHVQALNMIDIEFSQDRNPKAKAVIDAWKIYADHLNNLEDEAPATVRAWSEKGKELFTELLSEMSNALGYTFNKVELKRGIYYPRAFGEAEIRRHEFEEALVKIVTGKASLPMKVTDFPFSAEAYELEKKVKEGLIAAFGDDGAIKVHVNGNAEAGAAKRRA